MTVQQQHGRARPAAADEEPQSRRLDHGLLEPLEHAAQPNHQDGRGPGVHVGTRDQPGYASPRTAARPARSGTLTSKSSSAVGTSAPGRAT